MLQTQHEILLCQNFNSFFGELHGAFHAVAKPA
jgi:hypothetical protein